MIAVLGYLFIMGAELRWWTQGMMSQRTYIRLYGSAHAFEQWGGLVALIGAAERWLNRDRPIRPMLTEAVFPFYIAHQTIIVVVDVLAVARGAARLGRFRDPARQHDRGVLALLRRRAIDRLGAPADRVAPPDPPAGHPHHLITLV